MENPFSNAGDAVSISGLGTKIPHTKEQRSPDATTGEACVPRQRPSTAGKKKELTVPFKKNVRIWSSERKVTFPKSHSLSEVKLEFSAAWLGHFSRYRKWPHSYSRWTAGGLALPQKRLPQRRKTYVFWMSSRWVGPLPLLPLLPLWTNRKLCCQFCGFSCPCFRVTAVFLTRGVFPKERDWVYVRSVGEFASLQDVIL